MQRARFVWFWGWGLALSALLGACDTADQPLTDGSLGDRDDAAVSSSSSSGQTGASGGQGGSSSGGSGDEPGDGAGGGSSGMADGGPSCGSCPVGFACSEGRCKDVREQCPEGPASGFSREYPETWEEGQCIVRYRCENCGSMDNSVVRAHYFEPGGALHARRHEQGGAEAFTGADLLSNMGVELREAFRFCLRQPDAEGCERLQEPDCAQYADRVCQTLFNWSHDGRPIRLRRTGQTLWCEGLNPDSGNWDFHAGNWIDATGGLPPHTGYFCFAKERPAGDPEPCP